MNRVGPWILPSLLAFGAIVGYQDQGARPTIQAMETQSLQVFKELETKTEVRKDSDGTSTILFSMGETTGQLYQYMDDAGKVESLRLNVGYDVNGFLDPKKVNAFNEKRRFGKAYLDKEGDPFLVSDLDVQFGSNPGVLRAWIIRFRALVPLFEKEVLGTAK